MFCVYMGAGETELKTLHSMVLTCITFVLELYVVTLHNSETLRVHVS